MGAKPVLHPELVCLAALFYAPRCQYGALAVAKPQVLTLCAAQG